MSNCPTSPPPDGVFYRTGRSQPVNLYRHDNRADSDGTYIGVIFHPEHTATRIAALLNTIPALHQRIAALEAVLAALARL